METQNKESHKGDIEMSRASTLDDTWKVRYRSSGEIKTSLITAKDHERAERKAQLRYPNILSVSKAREDYYRVTGDERNLFTTRLMEDIAKPKMSPLAMDEFLWLRRNKRIENKDKDKKET